MFVWILLFQFTIMLSFVAAAASDIVRTSLTNAEELLKKEQMLNGCKEQE